MPGFPLLNLGTALGGLVKGYDQQQQDSMRAAIQQLALQQQQRQQAALKLAGLGLQAGLLGQQGLPPSMTAPQQAPPQPPMPGAASVSAQPQPQPSLPPSDDAIAAQRAGPAQYVTPQGVPTAPLRPELTGPNAIVDPDEATSIEAMDAVEAGQNEGLPTVGKRPSAAAPSPAPKAAAPQDASASTPASDSGAGHEVYATLPGGQEMSITNLFHTIDMGHVAQGLAKLAPPGTDPATIFEATQALVKLSEGDKTQQMQAAYLAKLMGINMQTQSRERVAGMQTQSRENIAGQQIQSREKIAGQNITSREGIAAANRASREEIAQAKNDLTMAVQDRIDARAKQRIDQGAERIRAAAANSQDKNLRARANTMADQIKAIKPDALGNFTPAQQQQLNNLRAGLGQIADQLAQSANAPQQ